MQIKSLVEVIIKDKHSSLLQEGINYGCEKFNRIEPWGLCFKTFYGRN